MSGKLIRKLTYASKCLPAYAWQRLTRRNPGGQLHLIIAVADHFEPSIVPEAPSSFAPRQEQERRVENWCGQYPRAMEP